MHKGAASGLGWCQGRQIGHYVCAAPCGQRRRLPTPGCGFYSSSRTDQSSQTAVIADEEDGRMAPRSASFHSKLGRGWAARRPGKTPVLSQAEQASRQALLTQNPKQDRAHGNNNDRPSKNDDNDLLTFVTNRANYHRSDPPAPRPRNRLQQGVLNVPRHIRPTDWNCPECNYLCFGKHGKCPSCHTLRPDLAPIFKRVDLSEQNIRIRKLGQSVLTDWRQGKLNPSKGEACRSSDKEQRHFDEAYRGDGNANKQSFGRQPRHQRMHDTQNLLDSKWEGHDRAHDRIRDKVSNSEGPSKDYSTSGQKRDLEQWRKKVSEREVRGRKLSKRQQDRIVRMPEFDDDDLEEDPRRRRREERKRLKKVRGRQKIPPSPLYLPEFISVSNLADVIGVRPAMFVKRMEEMGFEDVTYSHVLDAETAGLVAAEFNFEPIFDTASNNLTAAPELEDNSHLPQRPPVVTIMGHVDHGKTTILDWLRKSSIAASEHGGITQHIGAFSVVMPSGKMIAFLDTPGHAAFLDMRRRGADVTDIVVLVVAADDSVKPQTVEAIKHAKEANVPIIVAINKIDKDNADPERVKQDLARQSVDVEDYGGDVQAISVSGKTGQGMLELEEAITTLSELLDLRAPVDGNTEGWVIEATTKRAGRVATVLVRRGTMRPGDIVVAGTTWARIRSLRNESGVALGEAAPGTPVEVDGWKEQPEAGAEVLQAPSEQRAKDVVKYRLERSETEKLGQDMTAINESRRETLEKRRREATEEDRAAEEETTSGPKPVNFLIKADVSGSVEALVNSISAIGNSEVFAHILRSGVGHVGEFDVKHAAMAEAQIVSFNMPVDPSILRMADALGVKILNHSIIYELIDRVKEKVSEHLTPSVSQRVTGEAEVSQIFDITIKGRQTMPIAGCKVRNGIIGRTKKVRVLRGERVIYDGALSSLKNAKKDVTEMRKDTECGMAFESWTDFAVADRIQCYEEIYQNRYL